MSPHATSYKELTEEITTITDKIYDHLVRNEKEEGNFLRIGSKIPEGFDFIYGQHSVAVRKLILPTQFRCYLKTYLVVDDLQIPLTQKLEAIRNCEIMFDLTNESVRFVDNISTHTLNIAIQYLTHLKHAITEIEKKMADSNT